MDLWCKGAILYIELVLKLKGIQRYEWRGESHLFYLQSVWFLGCNWSHAMKKNNLFWIYSVEWIWHDDCCINLVFCLTIFSAAISMWNVLNLLWWCCDLLYCISVMIYWWCCDLLWFIDVAVIYSYSVTFLLHYGLSFFINDVAALTLLRQIHDAIYL